MRRSLFKAALLSAIFMPWLFMSCSYENSIRVKKEPFSGPYHNIFVILTSSADWKTYIDKFGAVLSASLQSRRVQTEIKYYRPDPLELNNTIPMPDSPTDMVLIIQPGSGKTYNGELSEASMYVTAYLPHSEKAIWKGELKATKAGMFGNLQMQDALEQTVNTLVAQLISDGLIK